MKKRLKQAFIESDQTKSIDVLNMQLRVACIDDQLHAVRYLLEKGADPFQIVSGIKSMTTRHRTMLSHRSPT
jgi:hypothetical protein